MRRRQFIKSAGVLTVSGALPHRLLGKQPQIKPHRLSMGNTIGIISPGGGIKHETSLDKTRSVLKNLGFKTVLSKNALGRWGYYSGTDAERVRDIHEMFSNPQIDAIITTRGGSGCNRLLPMLDYDLIKNNPKALIGYSDITALVNAIYAKTGLIGFHGPVITSTWNDFTINHFRQTVMEGMKVLCKNPIESRDDHIVRTINPGKAQGTLVGGNLSVISTMLVDDYFPPWEDSILFLEDVEEGVYRIDRMLMHLKLAGVLDKIRGIVFGQCTSCEEEETGFTLEEVLHHYIKPLDIPAWYGSMIGHIYDKFTIPVGLKAEINADRGTIQFLESAVL